MRLCSCGHDEDMPALKLGLRVPTPYYQDDLVTLYHGDCLGILTELAPRSVDTVLTDPPYSSGGRRENARSLRAIGIEIDERYCHLIASRLTAQAAPLDFAQDRPTSS